MLLETEELIKRIKKSYKVKDLTDLDDNQWEAVSGGLGDKWKYVLNEEFIHMYADMVDWVRIAEFQDISEDFIEKHIDYIEDYDVWERISERGGLSEEFIDKYADKLDWYYLLNQNTLSKKLLKKYEDKIDWNVIISRQEVPEYFIKKHVNEITDWSNVSKYQKLSEKFIDKYADRLDWYYISAKQNLSFYLVKRHRKKIDLKMFGHNDYIKEKANNLEKHPEWTTVLIKAVKENPQKDFSDILQNVFQTRKFWENYIDYLKEKYPEKIFQIKLLDTAANILTVLNTDKNRLLKIINSILDKKEKNPEIG